MLNEHTLTRRELLKLTAAGAGGICMSGWMDRLAAHAAAAPATSGRTPKQCILLWMDGGPSHIDTFDMKPNAPSNIRGEFTPVQTTTTDARGAYEFTRADGRVDSNRAWFVAAGNVRSRVVNENVAVRGNMRIAVSNTKLPANSPEWAEVSGKTEFISKRLFNLSLVGVDARFVKLSFHVEKGRPVASLDRSGGIVP